jgi:hypothetical protein
VAIGSNLSDGPFPVEPLGSFFHMESVSVYIGAGVSWSGVVV